MNAYQIQTGNALEIQHSRDKSHRERRGQPREDAPPYLPESGMPLRTSRPAEFLPLLHAGHERKFRERAKSGNRASNSLMV